MKAFFLVLMIIMLLGSIGISYAIFTTEVEKKGALNVISGELLYSLDSNDLNQNKAIIQAHKSKEFEINLTSQNPIDSKYELYYILNSNVEVGYLSDTPSNPSGVINANETKKIKVVMTNISDTDQEVTFDVAGSLNTDTVNLGEGKSLPKMTAYVLNNVISNASFENSDISNYTKYSYSSNETTQITLERTNEHSSSGNYSLYWFVNNGVAGSGIIAGQYPLVLDHIYYASLMYFPTFIDSSMVGEFDLYRVGGTTTGYPEYGNINTKKLSVNTWHRLSFSFKSTVSVPYNFRLDYVGNSTPGSFKAYYDDIMFIDLTDVFGSGKEPDKAWCDQHLPFFEEQLTVYK